VRGHPAASRNSLGAKGQSGDDRVERHEHCASPVVKNFGVNFGIYLPGHPSHRTSTMSKPPCSPTPDTAVPRPAIARKPLSDVHSTAARETPAPSFTDQNASATPSTNQVLSPHYAYGIKKLELPGAKEESETRPTQSGKHHPENADKDNSDITKLRHQFKHDPIALFKEALEKPAFFSCRVDLDRDNIFTILMSSPAPRTPQEWIDRTAIAQTVSFLSIPRWNPRNRVVQREYKSEDLTDWIWFLEKHRIPVFLWEYVTYRKMLDSLSKIGVGIDGGLVKLVTLKKQSFDSKRQIPFESFQIIDIDKAKHWILLPESLLGDQGQSLEEWTKQLLETASTIEGWQTMHTDVIVNNMKSAEYSKYGLENHLEDYTRTMVKMAVPQLIRNIAWQVLLRVNGKVRSWPLHSD
jgi:hypothetical protein